VGIYIFRRTLYAIALLFVISLVVFVLFSALPFDPASLTCGKNCTTEVIEANRIRLGYDLPMWEQYVKFLQGIFSGRDYGHGVASFTCPAPALGYSFFRQECVTSLLITALPPTIWLAIGSVTLWVGTGILLGIWAARRRGGAPDHIINVLTVFATSMPTFLTGQMALTFLIGKFGWIPPPDYYEPYQNFPKFFSTMFLPWIVLALPGLAIYARLTRGFVLETGSEDFVRTARAKGLPEKTILWRHTLRPALSPLTTLAALDLAFMLGGAVVTEKIFSIPGLGRLTIQSVIQYDLPVIVGTTILAAAFIVVANLIVDILYSVIDPRVRLK
jgi:peptide/nickel transport system permease protein